VNSLLDNAVISIQLGLEDYENADDRRTISAARNLYAGVLLLCKEVLRRLSPAGSNDVLIRTRMRAVRQPNATVVLMGEGNKTIDRHDIEERFKQLQIRVDLSTLRRFGEIRNEIEHHHARGKASLIQEAIADAMPIIRAVIVQELNEDPGALLGDAAWNSLLNEERVYKEEIEACRASLADIDWQSDALAAAVSKFRCTACSSALIRNENAAATCYDNVHFFCSKCGAESEREKVFGSALADLLGPDEHEAAKEGDGPLVDECPECAGETYLTRENRCVSCGFSIADMECAICGASLSIDDYRYGSENLCSYHSYVMSKDD
jgi:ribosomal protein L37E